MGYWGDDTWVMKGAYMAEEFFKNHRDTMPEDPHDVWKGSEIGYFTYSFVLWSAQTKFRLKNETLFLKRVEQYKQNLRSCFEDVSKDWEDEDPDSLHDYGTYLSREKAYMSTLMKSSSSLLKTLTGGAMKAACKLFIGNACKRYIFSERDLIKIISPWLVDKNVEFQRELKLGHEGD